MDIYVSNLSPYILSEDLKNHFSRYGVVASANIIIDKYTSRSRGFGFVTMPNDTEATKAIQEMDGATIEGNRITASKAKPREERPAGPYNNR